MLELLTLVRNFKMYKLIKNIYTNVSDSVLRIEDNTCIPFDPDNQDFVEYQKWLSEGNAPIPADKSNA